MLNFEFIVNERDIMIWFIIVQRFLVIVVKKKKTINYDFLSFLVDYISENIFKKRIILSK